MYYFGPSKDKQDDESPGKGRRASSTVSTSGMMAPQLLATMPNSSLTSTPNPTMAAASASGLTSLSKVDRSGEYFSGSRRNAVQEPMGAPICQGFLPNANNALGSEMMMYPAAPMHGQATMVPFNQCPPSTGFPLYGIPSEAAAAAMPFQAPLQPVNCGQLPAYSYQVHSSFQAVLPGPCGPFTPMTTQLQSPHQQVPVPCGPFTAPVTQLQSPYQHTQLPVPCGPFTAPATQFQPKPYPYQQVGTCGPFAATTSQLQSPYQPPVNCAPFAMAPQITYQYQPQIPPVSFAPFATTAPQIQPTVLNASTSASSASLPPLPSNQKCGDAAATSSTSKSKSKATPPPKLKLPQAKVRGDLKALWDKRYGELVEFNEANGHCDIPQRYSANGELGRWVKDQRTFKAKGKLSQERIDILDSIGFSWRIKDHDEFWNKQIEELNSYKETHGHCNVSLRDQAYNQLARWCDRQRRGRKKGKLSAKRKQQLDNMGFAWSLR